MTMNVTLIALAMAAIAAPAAANSAPAANKAQKASQPKYCIEYEATTGSRVRSAECLTKDEWARRGVDVANPNGK